MNMFIEIRGEKILTNEEIEASEGALGRKEWGPPSCILDFLYLGSSYNTIHEETLEKHDISHILNVAEEIDDVTGPHKKKRIYKKFIIADMIPSIPDHESVQNQWKIFQSAFDFIGFIFSLNDCLDNAKNNKGKVIVHCMRGRSRSATVVIAYLISRQGMTLKEAFVHVKKSRPLIGPHYHLRKQLVLYEKTHHDQSTLPKGDDWMKAEDEALAEHEAHTKKKSYPIRMKKDEHL